MNGDTINGRIALECEAKIVSRRSNCCAAESRQALANQRFKISAGGVAAIAFSMLASAAAAFWPVLNEAHKYNQPAARIYCAYNRGAEKTNNSIELMLLCGIAKSAVTIECRGVDRYVIEIGR